MNRRNVRKVLRLVFLISLAGCAFSEPRRTHLDDRDLAAPPGHGSAVGERRAPPSWDDEARLSRFAQQLPPLTEADEPDWSHLRQAGIASWYLDRRMANGQRYNRYAYTAAHRSLPFGTVVRVLNLENQREVVVRITDRGPFVRGRIIDLSEAGARQIGLLRPGIARVELHVLELP